MKALELLKDYKNIDFGCNVDDLHTEIDKAIKELEDLQNRKCEDCKHFSTGKQPDGFNWHKCEYSFECKTCFNDYFEKVEK